MELTPTPVRAFDLGGRMVQRNTAAVDADEAWGVSAGTARDLWEAQQPRCLENDVAMPFVESAIMRALGGLRVTRELTEVQAHGRSRILELSAAPVRDARGHVVGAVQLEADVTEQRGLERSLDHEVLRTAELESRVLSETGRIESLVEERARALAARQEAVARDRRLAAIGQLAAGVMHDVNNALNPIMAAAYLLKHHAESPDAVRDYADRIRTAAETGAATASRVGRFIRQEPLHPGTDEVMDLSQLANEVLEITAPVRAGLLGSASYVSIEQDYGDTVLARGIAGEIREALLNLVSNAMDAMPHGGVLRVATTIDGDDAVLAVSDTGVGMSDEVRERAFEPFFTTKGAGGSGLGLAEVYGIARRHRGSVTLTSTLGAGTTVTVRIPREQHAEHASPARAAKSSAPLRVLVVEDHDDGREFLRRVLSANGHTVDAVATLQEASHRLDMQADTYDMVLTDVGLPDGSGWDLVTRVRSQHPTLRIGVVTGWEPMVRSAAASGAEFVLRKPIRAAELLSHLASHSSPVVHG
jgi:signal transduction histidine kinase